MIYVWIVIITAGTFYSYIIFLSFIIDIVGTFVIICESHYQVSKILFWYVKHYVWLCFKSIPYIIETITTQVSTKQICINTQLFQIVL